MADPTTPSRGHLQPVAPFPERGQVEPYLPRMLTSFVGREREVAKVAAMIRRPGVRLVTLTGPGGVGKTRLMIRVAEEVAGDFPDGVWFVPLASVRDPTLVTGTIAQVLGVRESSGRSADEAMQAFLRDRRALLVVDNFEHLLEAAPSLAELMRVCPDLSVLVTSRSILRVSGEHAVAVPPLVETDALNLFAERARAAHEAFTVDEPNAGAIAEVCRRLDGLPLAIELVASRVRHLSPAAILGRLEPRLPLLTGGERDQPARLRTMRDAIAWSHDLLDPAEQTLFRRLAVFVGGFTIEAADAVAVALGALTIDVFDGIASLADKSLIRSQESTLLVHAWEARFGVLETIREFGLERLRASGEELRTEEAHAAYFLALAERVEPPDEPDTWYGENAGGSLLLEMDLANFRSALHWLADHDRMKDGLRLAGALGNMWYSRGHSLEGVGWLERFLGDSGAVPRVRLKALLRLAGLAVVHGDDTQTRRAATEGLKLARDLDDRTGAGVALLLLAGPDQFVGEYARAEVLHEEALALFREVGDAGKIATQLTNLAIGAYGLGDPARAAALAEEALPLWREVGNDWGLGYSLRVLGDVACDRGEYAKAAEFYAESLAIAQRNTDGWAVADSLTGYAYLALFIEHVESAARLFGAAEALYDMLSLRVPPIDRPNFLRGVGAVRARLGDDTAAAAWSAGRALTQGDAVAEALVVAHGASRRSATSTAVTADSPHDPRLTQREREILRLVAEGHTDREIAATLSIGERTVEWHLTNAFNKLGVNTRAAAATAAVRHGLI